MIALARQMLRLLRRRLVLARYNDYTIAEFFRQNGAIVGSECRIMIRSFGSEPFLVSIGDHCTIAPEASLVTHDGAAWLFTREEPSIQKFGKISIGDNCFIGLRATIMPGVSIGSNSIVGACSLVTRDVPPNTVVAGCPAVPICDVGTYRRRVEEAWGRQRPAGYLTDLKPGTHYTPEQIHACKVADMAVLREHLERVL